MPEAEVSAGIIEYEDTGGSGPVVVLLHGLAMDGSLWRHVVRELRGDHRCVVPTLPLGGHRRPMRADADLSPRGIARLEAEFLEVLDLRDVTLVGNDSGLFQFAAAQHPERIARLVITSCEAFENFPPGLSGTNLWLAAKLPGGVNASVQPLRLHALRRLPVAYGWMAKRPIPHEVTDAWLRPLLTRREIRRDLTRYLRAARKGDMLAAAEGLRSFERPALVIWAAEDRLMPPSTDDASLSCCPARCWWRSPTATRSSPGTSQPNWPGCCAISCASRPQPPAKRGSSAIKTAASGSRLIVFCLPAGISVSGFVEGGVSRTEA